MLVIDFLCLKLRLEFVLIDSLENVLETTVILLQDCVLGRQKQRPPSHERILEAGVGKSANALVRIVPKSEIDTK
jgi:hypothetical protein